MSSDFHVEHRINLRYPAKMPTSLTPPQTRVLSFIEDYQGEHGRPPSLREIADEFGYSSQSSAQQHVEALRRKGHLTRTPRSSRSLRVVKPRRLVTDGQTVAVPLVGRIAAGAPSFALEEAEEVLPLPRSLFRGRDLFALRVTGDSMVNVGIFAGDLAVLRAGPDFQNGDIAAVVVDEEATLKRVYRVPGGLRLHPENEAYEDRILTAREMKRSFRMAGVLVGTIRRFN